METQAKVSAVAVSLHTQVCSDLHVRDANRCEDTQRCNGPELESHCGTLPSSEVPDEK